MRPRPAWPAARSQPVADPAVQRRRSSATAAARFPPDAATRRAAVSPARREMMTENASPVRSLRARSRSKARSNCLADSRLSSPQRPIVWQAVAPQKQIWSETWRSPPGVIHCVPNNQLGPSCCHLFNTTPNGCPRLEPACRSPAEPPRTALAPPRSPTRCRPNDGPTAMALD